MNTTVYFQQPVKSPVSPVKRFRFAIVTYERALPELTILKMITRTRTSVINFHIIFMQVKEMHKYYIIDHSTDHKIIGSEYPQCTGLLKEYNNAYENPLSLYFFAHHKGKKIDFQPDLSAIRIGLKTKLTDCVSCSLGPGNDWVISPKFKTILKSFTTSPLQLFRCVLNRKEEKFNYWWIHFIYTLEKETDYSKSIFTHPDEALHEKLSNVKSYEDYKKFYDNDDSYGLVRATKTVLNSTPLDFFVVGQFNQKHYVSERLKDELQLKGISGVTFKEATDICFNHS